MTYHNYEDMITENLEEVMVKNYRYLVTWCMFEIIVGCSCVLQEHKKLNSLAELFFTNYLLIWLAAQVLHVNLASEFVWRNSF